MASAEEPTFLTLTVTLKMTAAQRAEYAEDYDLRVAEVTADIATNFRGGVQEALGASRLPLLRDYCTYSVSEAQ